MSTPAVQLLASLLALAALIGAVGITALGIAARRGRAVAFASELRSQSSLLCALVAGSAMAGSLYFSEVANYVPCTLCWYQRIAMYSIAVIAVTATIRRELPTQYFAVLAALGALVSTYHYLIERFPDLDAGTCSATIPCTLVWFERFGFVTLPFMALCGFACILAISLALPKEQP